jgi:hypothetical protein
MERRRNSPRTEHLKQEVAQARWAAMSAKYSTPAKPRSVQSNRKPAPSDSRSSRYLAAVAGAALLVAILAMEAPVGIQSSPTNISEVPQPQVSTGN